jgi:hypothetical protein
LHVLPESTEEKTDKVKSLIEEEEAYTLNYIVNFNNCTFNEKVVVKQTGKPEDDDPPGTGG